MVMVVLSVYWGRKHSDIFYNWNKILKYVLFVALIYLIGIYLVGYISGLVSDTHVILSRIVVYAVRIGLIIVFLGFVYDKEFKKKLI